MIITKPKSIHSESWSPNSADNLEFSAERLFENAKTISLNAQKLTILQYVSNNGQDVLTSLAENPISLINMFLVSDVLKFCCKIMHF